MCLPLQNFFQTQWGGVCGGRRASQRSRINLGPCISATLVARLRCLVVSVIATQVCKSLLLGSDHARGPSPQSHTPGRGRLGPQLHAPPQPHPCNIASQGNLKLCRIRAQRKELWVEKEYSRGGREPRYRGLQPCQPASEDTHLQSGDEQGPRAGSRQIQVHSQGALFLTLAVPLLSRPSKKSLRLECLFQTRGGC